VQKRAFLRSNCRCYKAAAAEPEMVNDNEHNMAEDAESQMAEDPEPEMVKAIECAHEPGETEDADNEGDPFGHGYDLDEPGSDQGEDHDHEQVAGAPLQYAARASAPAAEHVPPDRPEEMSAKIRRVERQSDNQLLTEAQHDIIAKNREAASKRKWARAWEQYETCELSTTEADEAQCSANDLLQWLKDSCLQLQVEEEHDANSSGKAKEIADSIMQELDAKDIWELEELQLKKRRLENSDAEQAPASLTGVDGEPFSLTQELEVLLEDEPATDDPRPQPPRPLPCATMRDPRAQLDPRSGELQARLHITHQLRTFRGLIWCAKCGYYSSYVGTSQPHVRALANSCDVPKAKGLDNLRRLGLHPRKWPHPLKGWPDTLFADKTTREGRAT